MFSGVSSISRVLGTGHSKRWKKPLRDLRNTSGRPPGVSPDSQLGVGVPSSHSTKGSSRAPFRGGFDLPVGADGRPWDAGPVCRENEDRCQLQSRASGKTLLPGRVGSRVCRPHTFCLANWGGCVENRPVSSLLFRVSCRVIPKFFRVISEKIPKKFQRRCVNPNGVDSASCFSASRTPPSGLISSPTGVRKTSRRLLRLPQ